MKFRTVYGVYAISPDRTEGFSKFFPTHQLAQSEAFQHWWETRIEEQIYELEEDSSHDCGDDE